MRRLVALLALALGGTLSVPALADGSEAPAALPPAAAPAPSTPAAPSPKRPIPDYDGRGPEPTTAGDVALWVPRIVLSPLYVVTEYVLRWPLSVAIPAAERAELPRKLYDFFTFGPEHKAGFAPVGFYDFGFNPSVGVYAFWNDAGFKGDDWHAHAEAWPTDWIAASLTDRIRLDRKTAVQFRVEGLHRPDRVFYGLGPDSLQSSQSRYLEDRVEGGAIFEWRFWRSSRVTLGSGVRNVGVHHGHFAGEPSVEQKAATGAFALPYGFDHEYLGEYNRAFLALDSRRPWPEPGSGLRIEAQAEEGSDVSQVPASGWVRYGGTAGGYLDLNDRGRVLGLAVTTIFADPLFAGGAIPFTELATFGGDGPMDGYFGGRMVGRSAAAASLHYLWPIGPWLDGSLETAVGNVFDEHLAGFRTGRLRFSGAVGVSTMGLSDYPIALIVGMGSETFEHGGQIDSARVTLSVNHGF
jgi:hypothetical protein